MSDVPLGTWVLLGGLLFLSSFFSSSETALFSLTPPQRGRAGPGVRRLLANPSSLLLSILLGNLVVNVLFFAFAGRLLPGDNGLGDLLVGLGALVALLICGEILPKTVGLRSQELVSRWAAPVLQVLVRVLGPLGRPLIRLSDGFHRMLIPVLRDEEPLTSEVLELVLERGAQEGHLHELEADLLIEIVELEDIRVREIMTPRVDALFMDLSGSDRKEVLEQALASRVKWLPVIEGDPDRIVGRVRIRDLLYHGDRSIRELVMPVKFVPEVVSALDLLRSFREDRTAEAVVVDEWGGTAGFVTSEDVLEEIVGDLRIEGEQRTKPVVPLGEGRFRVAGGLSIRDWNEEFGLAVVPTEFETVGGFITALLGRIPRAGDVARVGQLEMQVHEVRGRRVQTVDIGVAVPGAEVVP